MQCTAGGTSRVTRARRWSGCESRERFECYHRVTGTTRSHGNAPGAELATWPMAIFLLYKMLYNGHASPRGPCVVSGLRYSYTALYTIQEYITHYATPLCLLAPGPGTLQLKKGKKNILRWVGE
eukprot:scaffold38582_cov54-Phaeocystis_antarctica.AAC.1